MPPGFDPHAKGLPKARKDPLDPFVQVRALTDAEYVAERSRTRNAWKPITLRTPFLLAVISITLGLIGVVQWLLGKSQAERGILHAPNVNDLPLKLSFLYLYLPTLLSVIYSFVWTWIDLDVKRLEPYLQLSRHGGAVAEDSVLLHYPFDFLAAVPLKALRRRHWSVFAASMIMVFIFWGLTPIQAGLFVVRTVTITDAVTLQHANGQVPWEDQANVSAIYAQSVSNIAWFNESVPSFMTKEFVLRPFEPNHVPEQPVLQSTYTGPTDLYSLDLECEAPILWNNSGVVTHNSTSGCSFEVPPYRPMSNGDTSKVFDTFYAGHYDGNGNADWYLYDDCPESFWVRWSRSTPQAIASGLEGSQVYAGQANATSLYCNIRYFQQRVNATISLPDQDVVTTVALGEKQPWPEGLFNTTAFRYILSTGQQSWDYRSDYPKSGWPNQVTQLVREPLDLYYLPVMSQYAIATYQRPMEDYLDPKVLQSSYQAAMQLLFARRLVDILNTDMSEEALTSGERTHTTQAVIVVPGFAYSVQALLGLIACLASWLTLHTHRRANTLESDPASLLALMRFCQSSPELLTAFSSLTQYSTVELESVLKGQRFALDGKNGIDLRSSDSLIHSQQHMHSRSIASASSSSSGPNIRYYPAKLLKGIRPTELRFSVGLIFLAVQLGAIATFAYLYIRARAENGLPLPSQNTLVRQIVQNYILIAIATVMEPFWLVLNRLICVLQPWEELRAGKAKSSRSIKLNYSSLPPQFVFWRALRARHVMLALICLMTILANGLAIALSGVLYEDNTIISRPTGFNSEFTTTRIRLNVTGKPFNGPIQPSAGETTLDQFYREMSNLTAGTPYPPWVDSVNAYFPVKLPAGNDSLTFNISTQAVAADLDCQQLLRQGPASYDITYDDSGLALNLTVSVEGEDGSIQQHTNVELPYLDVAESVSRTPTGNTSHVALEIVTQLTNDINKTMDLINRQSIAAGYLRANLIATQPPSVGMSSTYRVQPGSTNASILLCTPRILIGTAQVIVSSDGRVQRLINSDMREMQNVTDLVAQVNQYLLDDSGDVWHDDSYSSDLTNYLIQLRNPGLSFLNASLPPPAFSNIAQPFEALYNSLFAMLAGTNLDLLFERVESSASAITNEAHILAPETRIFVSLPAFVVVQTILSMYVLVTIWLYLRRPWRILPRLPTTVAATIAYFAASNALREMQVNKEERGEEAWRGWRWGYGFFIGTDGKAHLGVEREPLLMALGKEAEKGLPMRVISGPIRSSSA